MPPRTRTAKSTKSLKENIGISCKTKQKLTDKITRAPRKVLGDKTNSASDENASLEIPNKTAKKPSTDSKLNQILHSTDKGARPQRDRRIPSRFVENQVLKNLSNNKENAIITNTNCKTNEGLEEITNNSIHNVSPFKSPQKVVETSLVANRPRRVSRLPTRFEDHSMSPSKFIPVQPCHASTPLAQKNTTVHITKITTSNENNKNNKNSKSVPKLEKPKSNPTKNVVDKKTNKISSDTNNNAQDQGRTLRTRKAANADSKPTVLKHQSKQSPVKNNSLNNEISFVKIARTPVKKTITAVKQAISPFKKVTTPIKKSQSRTKQSPVVPSSPVKHSYLNSACKNSSKGQATNIPVNTISPPKKSSTRTQKKDLSLKVLDDNKKNTSQDVYEFTFDPNEEPAPQKKKRKAAKRKPANSKPKKVTFKYNYDQNVNKALAALKNVVGKKPTPINRDNVGNIQQPNPVGSNKNIAEVHKQQSNGKLKGVENIIAPQVQKGVASKIIIGNTIQSNTCNLQTVPQIQENILLDVPTNNVPVAESNHSTRIEDIAADFECSPLHDMDYSPVNSPSRPKTPVISDVYRHDDPLNLRENISFEPNPIASSSMNTSVRHPHASPWRIEFESLPIRWHVSSYVKPNMTPAVECSFVNFDDKNKKKHVYTNLVPESNEPLPEITQKDQPNLVQTSIISFIKEMVEKSASKKNRGRSATPVTASLFNDVSTKTPSKDDDKVKKTTRQLFTPQKNSDTLRSDASNSDSSKDILNEKENSKDSSRGQKRKNNEEPHGTPAKTLRKEKDDKYFGFDDSENMENVSPQKNIGRKKSLRQARARAVLREINAQTGPTRAAIPVAIKSARKAEVDRLYDAMRSATDAPEMPPEDVIVAAAANVVEPIEELIEDSQTSVHLFEDIDVIHHLKPSRKSYGKAKKVTFIRQASTDTQDSDLRPENHGSDEEEDQNDFTFDPGMPLIEEERKRTKKKPTKRQKMTKKEEEEAEAWAAGFNSMCEDVEEFPLVVE